MLPIPNNLALYKHAARADLPLRERVEVIATKGNRVLMQRRRGYVEFPGGGLEEGEDREEAIRRETKEETGADLADLEYQGSVEALWYAGIKNTDWGWDLWSKYRGSLTHFYTARAMGPSEYPTSTEGDGWRGEKFTSISKALKLIDGMRASYGMAAYRDKQRELLQRAMQGKYAADEHNDTASFFRDPSGKGLIKGVKIKDTGEAAISEAAYEDMADLSPVHLYGKPSETDHYVTWRQVGEEEKVTHGRKEKTAAEEQVRASVLQRLIQAKKHSDKREYDRKATILQELLQSRGQEFVVDSEDKGIVGLTHVPTNFRIHMPAKRIPWEYLRVPAH